MARVLHGDSRSILPTLAADSFDSCVTDPPYALVSIVKRFGADGAAPAKSNGATGVYQRASAGFMGQKWDTGEVAFDPAFWAQVYRVLKPGAHVVAFGGARTYHRLACAIEDAGFEIRDQIMWVFGSGFPKSLDVSKQIDKRGGQQVGWFGPWLRKWREECGITQKEVAALFPSRTGNLTGCVANWELGLNLPTPEQFNLICATFGFPFASIEEAEREVIGQQRQDKLAVAPGQGEDRSAVTLDITSPATDVARQWQGWGTALKPAHEPIVVARKPLIGTVAENVSRYGTGAINVDGCRVGTESTRRHTNHTMRGGNYENHVPSERIECGSDAGRFPANLIHDGSDEVMEAFAAFGERAARNGGTTNGHKGDGWGMGAAVNPTYSDTGTVARFFYCAKADGDERAGSRHPTVKPLDLMRYLVRLVTPPGGVVLDPFAGTGTTGEAAALEGMAAVLIERDVTYAADIARRVELMRAGPVRRAEILGKLAPVEDWTGTLFEDQS